MGSMNWNMISATCDIRELYFSTEDTRQEEDVSGSENEDVQDLFDNE